MNLNLFGFLKNDIQSNNGIQKFMKELTEFLNSAKEEPNKITNNLSKEEFNGNNQLDVNNQLEVNNKLNTNEAIEKAKEENMLEQDVEKEKLQDYRKEGHLYLVTEDRNGKVYLWDLTDKPKEEIEEVDFPKDLLDKATEGSVFKYTNGTYEFYSEDGYDMLFGEKNEQEGL